MDIGAGTGDFQNVFIHQLVKNNGKEPISFTWLEPLEENIVLLKEYRRKLPTQYSATIIKDLWESYIPDKRYDIIILSHVLYYFHNDDFDALFEKMVKSLKPGGRLLVVARQEDEDFEFIQQFYERVTGQPFGERTILDAEKAIGHLQKTYPSIQSEKRFARSHIVFPFTSNETDAGKLVEFYLRKKWSDIDPILQQEITEYIMDPMRKGQLQQVDGILIVGKSV